MSGERVRIGDLNQGDIIQHRKLEWLVIEHTVRSDGVVFLEGQHATDEAFTFSLAFSPNTWMTRMSSASAEPWVGVTCVLCDQGAEHIPEKGPGTGWVYHSGDWFCPTCSEEFIARYEQANEDAIEWRRRAQIAEARFDYEWEKLAHNLGGFGHALKTLANPNPEEYHGSPYVRRMATYARDALDAAGDIFDDKGKLKKGAQP